MSAPGTWMAGTSPAMTAILEKRRLRRPDRAHEAGDAALEARALARQRLRGRLHLGGGTAGLGRTALHVGDAGLDLRGAFGSALHVAGNLLCGGALLLDRS